MTIMITWTGWDANARVGTGIARSQVIDFVAAAGLRR